MQYIKVKVKSEKYGIKDYAYLEFEDGVSMEEIDEEALDFVYSVASNHEYLVTNSIDTIDEHEIDMMYDNYYDSFDYCFFEVNENEFEVE